MKKNFRKKILDNGMTILFEKRNLPIISVGFGICYGGINESLEEKGIAHFIEHMLFKGTKKRNTRKIAKEIEGVGGELNGFTHDTLTSYWVKMPKNYLNTALEVLSDIIKNPLFEKKELEKERQVIFEEIKMRKDIPKLYVFEKIQNFLFTGTLSKDLIGDVKTLKNINRKKILEKFERIYSPNNLILCVVGDANFEEIVDYAEKNFGNKKNKISEQKFGLDNKQKIEKRKGLDQANLIFGYHIPIAKDKKNYAARVLNNILAEGFSSRLFEEIREKRNLAYAVKGGYEITKKYGYGFVYVGTTKENVEKVKKIILDELKNISEDLNEKELNESKKRLIGNNKISMEDSQEQMVNLLYNEVALKAEELYDFEKNISNVKLEDVKQIAKNAFEKYSFFALIPE